MYIVHDVITDTMVGPFDCEESAVMFSLEAGDLLNDPHQELNIYELTEPQEWAFQNLATEVAEDSFLVSEVKEPVNVS